jgi:hypothetical protein
MSWTRIGTVSVTNNSNAVVGTGTAFLTNSRIGDAFLGPDGVLYEVINVGSDTAISISPNYKGATNASAAYALIPVQGYPKALADAFSTLNNQFGATFAALGSSGTAAGIKTALGLDTTNGITEGSNNLYFTQARVLATPLSGLSVAVSTAVAATDSVLVGIGKLQAQVSAALPKSGGTLTGPLNPATPQQIASAATVDLGSVTSNEVWITGTVTVTSLGTAVAGARRSLRFMNSGLILANNASSLILPSSANITVAGNDTADFLSLGGGNWLCLRYNLASGKALIKDFAYDRSNVIGAVAQSAGIPTGALMEYGSNSGGEFWKFFSGLMITAQVSSLPALTWSAATTHRYVNFTAGFPATFVVAPKIVATLVDGDISGRSAWISNASATSTTAMSIWLGAPLNSTGSGAFLINVVAFGRWF